MVNLNGTVIKKYNTSIFLSQKHGLKSLVFLTGLICIFIEPRILNEARVSSYIRAILRHEDMSFW